MTGDANNGMDQNVSFFIFYNKVLFILKPVKFNKIAKYPVKFLFKYSTFNSLKL